ncbi:hypothetical protein OKA05_25465 [Luteolibacter arcticus]|uniref:Autotransporter-associated beta strand repeat-containing protein n=2 Tax=Luteolibacter arcticus TaxID=1581411 RepID=A0ABT3GQY1_9BACT|nr:hypothetical protein [Luteolibacter arcticus]
MAFLAPGMLCQAAPISWTTGTAGDASGSWDGAASTFNGQAYTGADDLNINGTAAKTITTSGAITTPLSLTVSSTGTTGATLTSGVGAPGADAVRLTGSALDGTLSKTGTADLVLANANNFGTVTISSGKFFVNAADGLGITGTLNVNSGAPSGVTGSYAAGTQMGNFFYDSTNLNASSLLSKDITFGAVGANTTYGMVMRAGATGAPLTTTLSGDLTGASNVTAWLDVGASSILSTWVLSGDNSAFAGNIRLNRGNIQFDTLNSMGTGTLFIQTNGSDGTGTNLPNLTFGFEGTVSNPIVLRAGSATAVSLNTGANNITLSNTLTLSGDATAGATSTFNKIGSGTLTLTGTLDTLERLGGTATATSPLVQGALDVGNVSANLRAGTLDVSGMSGSTLTLNSLAGAVGTTLALGTKALDINGTTINTFSGTLSGTGATVTKSSTGTQTLAGANTYTGGTIISGRNLGVGSNSALGTGPVTINASASYGAAYASGGAPFLRSSVTGLNVPYNLPLPATAGFYGLHSGAAAGSTVEWSGVISGGGTGVVLQIDTPNSGDSTSAATLSGTNTFAGQIRLNRGILTLTNASAAGTASLFLQSNPNASGNLVFSNSFTLPNNIAIGSTAANRISPGANNVELSGVISGTVSWSKAGTGTLTLSGANTFSAVVVEAGSLLVTSSNTGSSTVNSGGTLGGTGSIAGALTVSTGGTVAPGSTSAGDLAVGATTIAGAYAVEVDGANEDTLFVTGALNITGATLNVTAIGAGATAGEYIIATYTGALTGTFSGLDEGATVLPGYTITYATPNQIKLLGSGGPNYNSWAASFSPNPGLANVDFENDGFENGTEFILGGSPISGSNNPKIYSFTVDTNADLAKELVMTIAVPVGTPAFSTGAPSTSSFAGFGIAVQGSETLASFPATVTPVTPVTTNLPTLTPQGGVSYEYRSFSLGGSNGLPSKGFLRVQVINP